VTLIYFHLLQVLVNTVLVLRNIVNMDQIPLEFEFLTGGTYETIGTTTVQVRSQATIQATIFGDGVSRIKPLIVFRGKETRLLKSEKSLWDKRVVVDFQDNAWVDEKVMLRWLQNQWQLAIDFDGYSGQHTLRNTIPRMLVLDVHKAQKTPAVKDLMHRFNTLPVMVPAGCTSLVQPLDVCINKLLKDRIRALADQHYVDHILEWSAQKYTASERRILMT